MIRAVIGLWRARWGLARLAVAAVALLALAGALPAHLARVELAGLPGVDFAAEVRHLREAGRYGEAVLVADAAAEATDDPAAAAAVARERELAIKERDAILRRIGQFGLGALSGQGDSLERLVGAITADLFIVGDVRDLALQGGRYMADGETDGVILVLSGVGLATSVIPAADWAPAVLKVARKTGAMTQGLAETVLRLVRQGNTRELGALFGDVRTLAAKATPGGAVRLLRHADTPEDVAAMARFVERRPRGAFALYATGREGADLIKRAGPAADDAVLLAARKGPAGAAWLRAGSARALLRPHPLVGLLKGLWKGTLPDAAARIIERMGPQLWWATPAAAAWVLFEAGLLLRRVAIGRRTESASPAGGAAGARV